MYAAKVGLKMLEKAVYSSFRNYHPLFDANILKIIASMEWNDIFKYVWNYLTYFGDPNSRKNFTTPVTR